MPHTYSESVSAGRRTLQGLTPGVRPSGAGVIWNGDPIEPPVIPAKAGIQSDDSTFPKVCGVDSRFRGNDCLGLANDTTTVRRQPTHIRKRAELRRCLWTPMSRGPRI